MRAQVMARRSAPVAGEFGRSLFARMFPELDAAAHADCWLSWLKVTRGGWLVTGPGAGDGERTQGHVVRPGLADVYLERKRRVIAVSTVAQQTARAESGSVDQLDPAIRYALAQGPDYAYEFARARAHPAADMYRAMLALAQQRQDEFEAATPARRALAVGVAHLVALAEAAGVAVDDAALDLLIETFKAQEARS